MVVKVRHVQGTAKGQSGCEKSGSRGRGESQQNRTPKIAIFSKTPSRILCFKRYKRACGAMQCILSRLRRGTFASDARTRCILIIKLPRLTNLLAIVDLRNYNYTCTRNLETSLSWLDSKNHYSNTQLILHGNKIVHTVQIIPYLNPPSTAKGNMNQWAPSSSHQ